MTLPTQSLFTSTEPAANLGTIAHYSPHRASAARTRGCASHPLPSVSSYREQHHQPSSLSPWGQHTQLGAHYKGLCTEDPKQRLNIQTVTPSSSPLPPN